MIARALGLAAAVQPLGQVRRASKGILHTKVSCIQTYIAYNFFGPIPNFLYRDAQEMIIYHIYYSLGAWVVWKINKTPVDAHLRARPSRGAKKAQRLRNFPKNAPMGGFLGKHISPNRVFPKFKH